MTETPPTCELCTRPGGSILWHDASCRVIRVDDPHYPGFCRVIWTEHVREMSDLSAIDQSHLMRVVLAVEHVIRHYFSPDKINLASFGNVVPHLHWHIIPRWQDDRHFPEPIWGKVHHETTVQRPIITDETLSQALTQALAQRP